jgi:putative hydrolase of the HAD superfamily
MTAIVFDFAGVLFDWSPAALLQRLLPGQAGDDESTRHWVAQVFQGYRGDWAQFDRGAIEPRALAQRIAARTGLPLAPVQRIIDAVPHELQPVAPAVALLRRLHERGARLFFLSNMPAPYADHLEARHAFLRCFRDGVFSGRVSTLKPEPAIFALAAVRFGVPPAELLFLDDQGPNVAAAQACGWQALQFVDAGRCEVELRERGLL